MAAKSPASSSTSSKPASKNAYESGTRSAKQAFAAKSKLQLTKSSQLAPADQQGRRRSNDAFEIQVTLLEEDPDQPREEVDAKKQLEIMQSMAIRGVDIPLVVRWNNERQKYRVVDGAHRYRAAVELQLKEVPCRLFEGSDKEVLLAQFITNYHRSSFKTFETSGALVRLRDDYGMTAEEILKQTGISASDVTKYLKIHDRLIPEVQELVLERSADQRLSRRHLYAISQVRADQQLSVIKRVFDQQLKAEATEELVKKIKRQQTGNLSLRGRPMIRHVVGLKNGTAELRINRKLISKKTLLSCVKELSEQIEELPDDWKSSWT